MFNTDKRILEGAWKLGTLDTFYNLGTFLGTFLGTCLYVKIYQKRMCLY